MDKYHALVLVHARRIDLLVDEVRELEETVGRQAEAIRLIQGHRRVQMGMLLGLDKRLNSAVLNLIGWMRTGDSKTAIRSVYDIKNRVKPKAQPALNLGEWDA